MHNSALTAFLQQHPCILGEGAVIERLRRDSPFALDEHVVNSAFVYEPDKRDALAAIYHQYLRIGRDHKLPLLLSTPTWRASRERIAAAGLSNLDLNADNFSFMDEMRRKYGDYADHVLVCGLMSCKGNAYNPLEALRREDSYRFHRWQAEKLAATEVDFIMAATLPALSEATGLAEALATTGKPYIISFVVRRRGTLLDGTPLHQAIAFIDAEVNPKPLSFMVNCTHARIFQSALLDSNNSSDLVRHRMIGLLANTADLEPEELDERNELIAEDPEIFSQQVSSLRSEFGIQILGGCCGTDDRHIAALAKRLCD